MDKFLKYLNKKLNFNNLTIMILMLIIQNIDIYFCDIFKE